MVEKSEKPKVVYKGIIKEVRSADQIVMHRTMKDGTVNEKKLNLSNI